MLCYRKHPAAVRPHQSSVDTRKKSHHGGAENAETTIVLYALRVSAVISQAGIRLIRSRHQFFTNVMPVHCSLLVIVRTHLSDIGVRLPNPVA